MLHFVASVGGVGLIVGVRQMHHIVDSKARCEAQEHGLVDAKRLCLRDKGEEEAAHNTHDGYGCYCCHLPIASCDREHHKRKAHRRWHCRYHTRHKSIHRGDPQGTPSQPDGLDAQRNILAIFLERAVPPLLVLGHNDCQVQVGPGNRHVCTNVHKLDGLAVGTEPSTLLIQTSVFAPLCHTCPEPILVAPHTCTRFVSLPRQQLVHKCVASNWKCPPVRLEVRLEVVHEAVDLTPAACGRPIDRRQILDLAAVFHHLGLECLTCQIRTSVSGNSRSGGKGDFISIHPIAQRISASTVNRILEVEPVGPIPNLFLSRICCLKCRIHTAQQVEGFLQRVRLLEDRLCCRSFRHLHLGAS
mmetsp:Transcript_35482/g.29860  ORF Transcript_35482/g.29860 Transcript_35482/m.29860 type:complete len:358 (+) Transcript_35482:595-1668(+)